MGTALEKEWQRLLKKEEEILILRRKLTELRLIEKMQKWTFQNAQNL